MNVKRCHKQFRVLINNFFTKRPSIVYGIFWLQSLFINIPLDEIIHICVDMVYNKCKKNKGMLKHHFKQLLMLLVKSFFLFNVYYKHHLSFRTNISNLFLTYYEDAWLDNCQIQFWPRCYLRYIDDVFLMFQHKDQVKKFLIYEFLSYKYSIHTWGRIK